MKDGYVSLYTPGYVSCNWKLQTTALTEIHDNETVIVNIYLITNIKKATRVNFFSHEDNNKYLQHNIALN